MIKRNLALVMLSACMVVSCCGWGKASKDKVTLPIPEWLSQQKKLNSGENDTIKSKVHFYYDNTTSMYPFVCNKDGKSAGSKGAAVSGPLVNWISAIREILQDNGGSAYVLKENKEEELRWAEYKGDIHNNFSNKSFYTYDAVLPKDGDGTVGPLAQLYFKDALDKEAINIVLTDLAEQSVNNTALASVINQKILSQDGYSVAIIAVSCNFNGEARVPDPREVDGIIGKKVNGKRPLYMILTGKNEELESIYNKLLSAMEQQGLRKDVDYYTHYRQSDASVNSVSAKEVLAAPSLVEAKSKSFKKYIPNSIFYDNVGVEPLSESETADLFGEQEYLEANLNAYTYEKSKRMVLNYYIPLDSDKENEQDIMCRLGLSMQEDEKEIDSEDAAQVIQNKDYVVYDYIVSETVEKEEEATEATEEQKEEKSKKQRRKRSKRKKKARKTKETVSTWYRSSEGTTTLKDFQDSFEVKVEKIPEDLNFDDEDAQILNGVKIYDKDGEVVEVAESGERGKKTYALSEEDNIDLSSASQWIHISIEGIKEKYDSNTVGFSIPVYAYVAEKDELPQWVDSLNANASEVENSNYYTHTFNLSGFYSSLFGVNTNGSEFDTQVEQEMKIAEINTIITGLPAEKSKR